MRQKVFAGHAVRRLREKLGLKQVELAHRLGVSASYVNQIESNQRPLSASVLHRHLPHLRGGHHLFRCGGPRPSGGGPARGHGGPDISRSGTRAPGSEGRGEPLARLCTCLPAHACGAGAQRPNGGPRWTTCSRSARRGEGKLVPYEEVRDYFHYIDNYVDDLDRAAEAGAEEMGILSGADPRAAFAAHLSTRFGVEVETAGTDPDAPLSRYDARRRRLHLSGISRPPQPPSASPPPLRGWNMPGHRFHGGTRWNSAARRRGISAASRSTIIMRAR